MVTAVLTRSRLRAASPRAGDVRVAVRVAVSVVVPLLVLDAIGHLPWSLYAAFGAFTSLYGRERVDAARLRLQATAGAWQVGAITAGALVAASPHRSWLAVPVVAVVAVTAAYASEVQGWHPPGSLFQVFAVGAVASVPGRLGDVVPALLISAAAAVFAMVVGNAGALVRRVRRSAPLEVDSPIGGSTAGAWAYGLQAGAGVLVAGSLATALQIGRPYWAMVSAVVPLAARVLRMQLLRGAHRLVGTGLGLLVAWAVLSLHLSVVPALLLMAVLQAGAEIYVGRNYALALVFITPLALLMGDLVRPVPTGGLLADRAIETVLGVVVGVAIGWALTHRPDGRRPL